MERAVKRILYEVPPRPWEPRVAEVSGNEVVLNGGEDVRLKKGSFLWCARRPSRSPIPSPAM